MRYVSLFIVGLFLVTTTSTQAGQLFPPMNEAGTESIGNVECPLKGILYWDGERIKCKNPSLDIDIQCPDGTVLVQIENGTQPKCIKPSDYVLIASCPDGQKLTAIINGQSVCAPMTSGEGGGVVDYVCPEGMVGYGIEDGKVVCRDLNYSVMPATCPSGTLAQEAHSTNIGSIPACVPNGLADVNISCDPKTQKLQSIVNGVPVCIPK